MAFSLIVATSKGSPDGAAVTTDAVDTTGATLLTLAIASFQSNPAPTPTDSKGCTWTPRTAYTPGSPGEVRIQIFDCAVPTVGSGHTFSASESGSFVTVGMLAFSGDAASPHDQENGAGVNANTNPTTIQPGSVTPSEDDELLVTAVASQADISSINGSFTLEESVPFVAAQHWALGMAYKIQTSAGAENPTWTAGAVSTFGLAAAIETYKAAATGALQPAQGALTLAGLGTSMGFKILMPDEV